MDRRDVAAGLRGPAPLGVIEAGRLTFKRPRLLWALLSLGGVFPWGREVVVCRMGPAWSRTTDERSAR